VQPSPSSRKARWTATTPSPRRPSIPTSSAPTSPRCSTVSRACWTSAVPAAVARRRKTGQRTARENIDDLVDPGSFSEYGGLVIAGRRRRHSVEELIDTTPADGLVMGFASINGDRFGEAAARAAVLSYDYTVLAGTQGARNHEKMDRMLELAHRWRLPTVFFTEGGGGRPGDTERGGYVRGFEYFGRLSGMAPLIGVTSGRCFAGNAAILGCCDVIIATRDSTIGMGGPAMIEGGGLGVFRPEEIGPVDVQQRSGVIDVLVDDEAAAVRAARQYLAYFQGPFADWTCADQRALRRLIPENRLRVYDIRKLIETLADDGSVLELRPRFGPGMITAFARIEGRPVGIIANNPAHLGGAIDSDGSDKAARFMQVCEAFDIPLVSLSDTPGQHGRPRAREDRARPPLQPHVRHRGQPDGAAALGDPAQELWPWRHRHDRRQLPGLDVQRQLAHRRVRRDGAGGLGQARLPQRAGGDFRPRRTPRQVRVHGRRRPTRPARRSPTPPPATSTTSSTPPTRAAGSSPD
jgi:acetyl-CoA carboxylase beta subunit